MTAPPATPTRSQSRAPPSSFSRSLCSPPRRRVLVRNRHKSAPRRALLTPLTRLSPLAPLSGLRSTPPPPLIRLIWLPHPLLRLRLQGWDRPTPPLIRLIR